MLYWACGRVWDWDEGWDRQAAFRYPALISDGLNHGYGILKLGLGYAWALGRRREGIFQV
jgi:hypothetical protein